MSRTVTWVARCVVALVFSIALGVISLGLGAPGDSYFEIRLPNDYVIISNTWDLQLLSRRDAACSRLSRRLLAGGIPRWAQHGELVVGFLSTDVFRDPAMRDVATDASREGYFILDTRSGELRSGLTEAEYLAALATEPGGSAPRLRDLSPLQRFCLRCLWTSLRCTGKRG